MQQQLRNLLLFLLDVKWRRWKIERRKTSSWLRTFTRMMRGCWFWFSCILFMHRLRIYLSKHRLKFLHSKKLFLRLLCVCCSFIIEVGGADCGTFTFRVHLSISSGTWCDCSLGCYSLMPNNSLLVYSGGFFFISIFFFYFVFMDPEISVVSIQLSRPLGLFFFFVLFLLVGFSSCCVRMPDAFIRVSFFFSLPVRRWIISVLYCASLLCKTLWEFTKKRGGAGPGNNPNESFQSKAHTIPDGEGRRSWERLSLEIYSFSYSISYIIAVKQKEELVHMKMNFFFHR